MVRRYPSVVFFVVAYVVSWVLLIPVVASPDPSESPLLISLYLLGAFGPSIAAVVTAWGVEGRDSIRGLLKKLVVWRVGLRWYLVVLFVPVLIKVVSVGVLVLLGYPSPDFSLQFSLPVLIATVVIVGFVPGAIGEELGWRGYALPQLQRRFSALTASLIVGVFWALWHLPTLFIGGEVVAQSEVPLVWFMIEITAMSVLYAWVVNNTRGSVLMAMLLHASNNGTTPIIYPAINEAGYSQVYGQVLALMAVLAAVFIVLIYGHEDLSRGQTRVTSTHY